MAAWPSSLPQLSLLEGAAESPTDPVIRTDMDVGPAKRRARYTWAPRRFTVPLVLTTAQVATFETFYESTLGYGVDAFDWTHPRTLASVSFAFVRRPDFAPIGAGYWRTSLDLELQP